jgi:hypothetical protein
MNKLFTAVTLGVSLLGGVANASDPIGIYGRIDKVVLQPTAAVPLYAQIWGKFAVAKQGPNGTYLPGGTYLQPTAGYLYYKVTPGFEKDIRLELADIASVAGSTQCIGFGTRYTPLDRVRTKAEPAAAPAPYPIEKTMGVMKISHQNPQCEALQ